MALCKRPGFLAVSPTPWYWILPCHHVPLHGSNSVLPNWRQFCPSRDIWQCHNFVGCHALGWVKAPDAAKYPTVHSSAPTTEPSGLRGPWCCCGESLHLTTALNPEFLVVLTPVPTGRTPRLSHCPPAQTALGQASLRDCSELHTVSLTESHHKHKRRGCSC